MNNSFYTALALFKYPQILEKKNLPSLFFTLGFAVLPSPLLFLMDIEVFFLN